MDWNENTRPYAFVPPAESSLSFLYNYNYPPYPVEQPALETPKSLLPEMDKMNYGIREKKKRLTRNQIESLERSFQEKIKLEPDRKKKLSKELGIQPRQIAVWYQNRRTRWRAKQLEHMYDTLKQEFHEISKEKQKLQDEVMRLKARLREQAFMDQIYGGCTEIYGKETVENTSEALDGSNKLHSQIAEEYCATMPHWTIVPYYTELK